MKSSTDTVEPKRAKLRKANEDPKCTMSRTDSENTEPNRAKPSTDTAEPIRAKLLSESDEPRCKKSSTDSEEPTRRKDLSDKADPR